MNKKDERNLETVKIIKITDHNHSNTDFNVLISMKKFQNDNSEKIIIKVYPLNETLLINKADDKLSLNKIEALIDHSNNSIAVGPTPYIYLEKKLQNKGIGSYLFNELLEILKKECPEYSIQNYSLILPDDTSEESLKLLKHFLEQFGINIELSDLSRLRTSINFKKPKELKSYYNHSKIELINLKDYIIQSNISLCDKEARLKIFEEELGKNIKEPISGISKDQLFYYVIVGCVISLMVFFVLLR